MQLKKTSNCFDGRLLCLIRALADLRDICFMLRLYTHCITLFAWQPKRVFGIINQQFWLDGICSFTMRSNEEATTLILLIGILINSFEFPVGIQNDRITNRRRLIHWWWKRHLLGKFPQFFQKHPYASFLYSASGTR